ncbi:MAG: dockerin type I domain-containing protein [Patescibacteria group bacterium]
MEKINQKKAVYKAFNIASLTIMVFYMTVAGIFLAPKSVSSITVDPCPDLNADNQVNLSDLAYLGDTFGKMSGDSGFNSKADFDQDGDVDEFDKLVFEVYYNKPFICGSPMPEFDNLCPDYNDDGIVNLSDLSYFTTYKSEDNFDKADFDQDGDIDEFDLAFFEAYYNTNYVCPIKESKMVSTPTPEQTCFPNFVASAEHPNMVNLSDFAAFGEHYNSVEGDGRYDSLYDANGDGEINETDKIIFSLYYNKPFTCGQTRIVNITDMLCPDFNNDGKVNLSDLAFFGQYVDGQNTAMADFDSDGDVDDDDLSIFSIFYNTDYDCGGSVQNVCAVQNVAAPVPAVPCPDFNGDNQVNLSDFSFFSQYMSSNDLRADFDGSGKVDDVDLNIFSANYNKPFTCGQSILIIPVCGDSKIEGEECDDGNVVDGDGCSSMCKAELGYTCAGTPSICSSTCGDTIMAVGAETCDEGANNSDTPCVAGIDQTCTYCTTSCVETTVFGPETQAQIVPITAPKLTIAKSVESGTYYPGDKVNFIITIKNTGTDTAYNVRLADTMPAGFTYDDGSEGSWFFSDLKIGQEMNHIYTMTIGTSVVPGTYTNTAQVSADKVAAVTATANLDVIAKPGAVLGAETKGTVEAAEEETLPAAGIFLIDYLIMLFGLRGLAFILKK